MSSVLLLLSLLFPPAETDGSQVRSLRYRGVERLIVKFEVEALLAERRDPAPRG